MANFVEFTERLKSIRQQNNIPARQMALILEITDKEYQSYEIGAKEPAMTTLIEIAGFFKVPVDYLIGLSDRTTVPDPNAIFQNRAVLQNETPVSENQCEKCYEPLMFALASKKSDFSIGLYTILECLRLAEKQGAVPGLAYDWWYTVMSQYPEFSIIS